MGETPLRFDISFLLLLGIACYWGWSSTSFLTPSLWPDAHASLSSSCWVANVASHLVCLFAVGLARSSSDLLRKRSVLAAFPALIVAGTGAIAAGYATSTFALALAGSIVSGTGTALALILWNRSCLFIEDDDERHFIIAGSVILSLLVVLMVANLPSWLAMLTTLALPCIMACCLCRVNAILGLPLEADVEHPRFAPDEDRTFFAREDTGRASGDSFRHFIRLLAGCLMLALPAGLYQNGFSNPVATETAGSWSQVIACGCLLISVMTLMDFSIARRFGTNIFSRLAIPLMAGGLLILSLSASFSLWAGVFLQTGYYLFLIYIYTEFGSLTLGSRLEGHRIVALGTCAIDTGLLCGFGLVQTANTLAGSWLAWFITGVAYLLVLAGILILPSVMSGATGRKLKNRSDDKDIKTDGARGAARKDGLHESRRSCFAQDYGLSKREEEILGYLLEGRTLRSIADKTFLSYNTVKTHVSHIYRKASVHTRDELIEHLDHRR